jgi:hypothetical protein
MKRILITIALALSAGASAEAACTTPSLALETSISTEQLGTRMALGDVNRDAMTDLVSPAFTDNEVRVYRGNGFDSYTPYAVSAPRFLFVRDVNNDEWPDLIVNHDDTKLGVLLNNGNGTFAAVASVDHGINTMSSFDAGDIDGDNDIDLVVADLNGVHLYFNNGSGAFPTKTDVSVPGIAEGALLEYLNADGDIDLVVAYAAYQNGTPGRIAVYLNSPNLYPSTASYSYTFPSSSTTISLAKGDLNNDNKPDFAVSFFNGFATYLSHSSGNGTLTPGMSMTISSSNGVDFVDVVMADFTEDGKQDLAFASLNGTDQYVIVGLGNGNFQTPPNFIGGAYSHSNDVEAADMDHDGRVDLVRLETESDQVQIFRNTCAQRLAFAYVLSSENPATYGDSVTFTAHVAARPGSPMPTGDVSLYVDGVLEETLQLLGGSVSFMPFYDLAPGYHSVRVEYAGDDNYAAATSATLSQEILLPPFGTPVAFKAFRYGPSTTAIHMTWVGVQGASEYQIERMNNGGTWTLVMTTSAANPTEAADLMVPDSDPQVYRIRALRTVGDPSAFSAPDIATSFIYSNPNLNNTAVRAADVTELRTLINGLRTRVGLATTTFTDASLAGKSIKAVHVTELRTALDQALAHLGLPPPAYTQFTLTAGITKLRLEDLQELRDAIY